MTVRVSAKHSVAQYIYWHGVKEPKSYLWMRHEPTYLMKEVGVAVVPGDNFYGKSDEGKKYLRFAACRSDTDIDNAIVRLQEKLRPAE